MMDDIIKTWPKRIYLQVCAGNEEEELPKFAPPYEITWCKDKQFATDIEYVRAGIVAELRARIAELNQTANDLADGIVRQRKRIAELEAQLAESRANDRTAMGYLSDIRKIVGGDDFPDMVRRIAELEARQVPEGWQAVPKEPTPEMENAACEAADNGKFSGAYLRAIYRAMLAATPSADSGEVKP